MKLLPYDTFTLETREPLPLVRERLAAEIERPKLRWGFSRNHAPYEGKLSDNGFEIHRIIHYRNSFLPIIRGRFEPLPEGTKVRITMGLHPLVMGFLAFWFLSWYSAILPMALFGLMPPNMAVLFVGLPLCVLMAFGCAFWYEADRSRRELTQMILGNSTSLEHLPSNSIWPMGIGVAIAVGIVAINIMSWQPPQPNPCNLSTHQSPYCNLSVAYTLESPSNAVAISSDGQMLVSGGNDKALKVWDLAAGKLKKTLQSDSGIINAIAIAPDNKTLISGSADRIVRIWNLETGQRQALLKGHAQEISSLAVSADGKTLVSGSSDGTVKVWQLPTGKLKATFPDKATVDTETIAIGPLEIQAQDPFSPVKSVALSRDGKQAVSVKSNQIQVWNLATGQLQAEFSPPAYDPTQSAVFSPDGQTIVSTHSQQIKVWDLATGEEKTRFRDSLTLNAGILTPDGQHAIALLRAPKDFADQRLKVWNANTGQLEAEVTGGGTALAASPDGKTFAVANYGDRIQVWR
jgi:WD40 repeat protein